MKRQVLVEFVVLVLLLVQSVFLHVFPGQVIHGIAAAVLVLAFVLHTWRVELTPGYILFLLNAGCGLTLRAPPLWLGWVQGVLFIFVIAATFLFPLPLFPPPSPLHPHVGCVSMRLRGVDCRIFYPTNAKDVGKALPYLHHGKHLAIGLHTFIKLPAWFFASLSNGTLWARGDVPLAKAPHPTNGWPVMIFSHGMGGSLEMYSSITQYVASEGFVVIVVNHDDGSASVSRNVDEITYSYYQRPPQSALDDWVGEGYFIRNKQVHARVRHVRAVLDALVDLQTDEGGLFYEGLNLDHVAAAGHSFGGATVLTAAKRDSRIKVVVGLDMWLEPIDADVVAEGVPDVAVCSIISQHWMDEWDSHFEQLKTMARRCRHPSSAFFALAQTRHNNFCDLALFSPYLNQYFKASGKIRPTYMLHMVGQLMGAYLRENLEGETGGVFHHQRHQYPELIPLDDDDGSTATSQSEKTAQTFDKGPDRANSSSHQVHVLQTGDDYYRHVRELTQRVLDAGEQFKTFSSCELQLVHAACSAVFHDLNAVKHVNRGLLTQVEVVQEKVHEYDESAASDDLYEKKLLKLRNLQRQAMESADAISRIRRSMVAKEKALKEHEPAVEAWKEVAAEKARTERTLKQILAQLAKVHHDQVALEKKHTLAMEKAKRTLLHTQKQCDIARKDLYRQQFAVENVTSAMKSLSSCASKLMLSTVQPSTQLSRSHDDAVVAPRRQAGANLRNTTKGLGKK
ncbi:hypothetical protein H310_05662 [Aphanomyces invadans]|uniref:1-alkyl-2-acetylglycerophosphocholine esterase n=1 Tax=Aphanomyces invadans TaxID=157072 RepID=A0A024U750_9STRA|nr:hypothetical protein H310_05662 [Aphanomyces invadans]ETW02045.1 hypothetical protein H310_05662 [Aphanomyces invadans]|eukprot:XP_008868650.1 hypothetical protein H310_05662 [Aphanomyces invadans]